MISFLHVVKNMGAKSSLANSTFHSFGHQEKGKKKSYLNILYGSKLKISREGLTEAVGVR